MDAGVYQLIDELGFCATLLVGSEKALLLDTMSGLGDLPGYLAAITDKPLTVVNSHIHIDHTGGNCHFAEAWLSPKDMPFNLFGRSAERRQELVKYLDAYAHGLMSEPQRRQVLSAAFDAYRPLEPGRRFELGGLSAEAVALPGHTPGSMGLLLREQRLLLSGDAMTPVECLFFPESLPLADYRATLDYAMTLPFDRFITGHSTHTLPKEQLLTYIAAADMVPQLRGMHFVFDLLPIYEGKLYLYHFGESSDDTIGVILKD